MYCKNCGSELADTAKYCPNCGTECGQRRCIRCGKELKYDAKYCDSCGEIVPDTAMYSMPNWPYGNQVNTPEPPAPKKKKKLKLLPTLLAIILIFVGCSMLTVSVSDAAENGLSSSPANKTKGPYSVGESARVNDVTVTLVDVSESRGGNYMAPESGNVFVICEFEIENNSSDEIAISSMLSFESYFDDYTSQISLSAMVSSDKQQLDGTVAAGKKMHGVVGYEVASDWEELEIRFEPNVWLTEELVFTYAK